MQPKSLLHELTPVSGARWRFQDIDERAVAQMMQTRGLPEIVARLLSARKIPVEQAEEFLFPTLKDHFPNPLSLAGMAALTADLAQDVIDNAPIAILADFDVDGATSAAILKRSLAGFGVNAPIYIPDRLNDGYGPNVPLLTNIKMDGAETVIIADCGTTAHDVIEAGKAMGLKIMILDHHEPEETLPEADHLINPKRADDSSGLSMLAACGVCFLTCIALKAELRGRGFFAQKNIPEPDLKTLMDLVALGTVCDMVPLTGPNRLLTRAGLHVMNQRQNAGIRALCETAKITGEITPMQLGFGLGPRINAGSRVHRSDLGAKLLSTDSDREAQDLAWALHDCNERRKEIQKEMMRMAETQIKDLELQGHPVMIIDLPDGHAGLSGLVAGRIKDKYGKPACVVTYQDMDSGVREGRGSGRSVQGVSMAELFAAAREADVITKGGGHAMAGGFTILPNRVDDFRSFVADYIAALETPAEPQQDLMIDSLITVQGAAPRAVKILEDHAGPFGQGHEPPRFALADVTVSNAKRIGNGSHVMCQVSDREGGTRMKGIAFGIADDPLGQTLLKANYDQPLHLAGSLKFDNWSGTDRSELHIEDAAIAAA